MLARSFLSAAELGLSEAQRYALILTLNAMERGEIRHVEDYVRMPCGSDVKFSGHFNMADWIQCSDCGTVACIGGTAELLGGGPLFSGGLTPGLMDLFYSGNPHESVEEAAVALSTYLTTGSPPEDW